MYKGNISDLSQEEQDNIELQKRAAFLIYKLKMGKINRPQINEEIENLPPEKQDIFKGFLNHYKGSKKQ